MTVVDVHDAKTRLSELLDRALRGEDVMIAEAGKPAVRLTPVEPAPTRGPRVPGALAHLLPPGADVTLPEFTKEELGLWEGPLMADPEPGRENPCDSCSTPRSSSGGSWTRGTCPTARTTPWPTRAMPFA